MRAILCITLAAATSGCAGNLESDGEHVAATQEAIAAWETTAWATPAAPPMEPAPTAAPTPARVARPSLPLTGGAMLLSKIASCRSPARSSAMANAFAMRCLAAVLSAGE